MKRPDQTQSAEPQQAGCWLPHCGSACGGMSAGPHPSYKYGYRATNACTELGTGSTHAQKPRRLGGALQRALGECFSEEGTSTPTPGMGVEVAKWNRVWGKSIQGMQRPRRTTWSICRTKDSLMEIQSRGQGPVGERAF